MPCPQIPRPTQIGEEKDHGSIFSSQNAPGAVHHHGTKAPLLGKLQTLPAGFCRVLVILA